MNLKKIGVGLVAISIILVVLTLLFYGIKFYHRPLSDNVGDWGAFGSYVGGVLGATIPALALIGAVLAIFQQQIVFAKSNNQVLASDIFKTIERLEQEIDTTLKENKIHLNLVNYNYVKEVTAFDIATKVSLFMYERTIPHYEKCSEELKQERLQGIELGQRYELYELYNSASHKLEFMVDLIEKHKRIVGNNIVALYYKKKYGVMAKRLNDRGYPIEPLSSINDL